jgi:hypothetical protein
METQERYQAKGGEYVEPDGWGLAHGNKLERTDEGPVGEFPGCRFRLTPPNHPEVSLAVNVHVTGGDHWDSSGQWRCRCRIEFVGEDEPSRFSGAWLYHD